MQRINDLEDDYNRQTRLLEDRMEEVQEANHQFSKMLDDKAERLRFIVSNYDPEAIPPLSYGYNMLSQAQDEVSYIVRKELSTLEEQNEEVDAQYRKDVARLEEDLLRKDREGEAN